MNPTNQTLTRREAAFLAFYMVFMPFLLLFTYTITYVGVKEVIAAIFCGGVAIGVYYFTRKSFDVSSHISVSLAISSIIVTIFLAYVVLGLTDENVFEYFMPYLGALSAWAVATIMWQEARWFVENRQITGGYSEALVESIGFGVALLYTALYVLIDLYGREPDSASALFLGLLVTWVGFRYILFRKPEEHSR